MKTIKSQLIKSLAKNATWMADSSCWNYHNSGNLDRPNSNLSKTLAKLPKLEKGYRYLVVVGAIGQSAHSKTDLHIFKAKAGGVIGTVECLYRSHWWVA